MATGPLTAPALALLVGVAGWGCSDGTGPTPTPPPPPPPAPEPVAFELTANEVLTGLSQPVFLAAPPGDSRLFVVEQTGRIRIANADGELLGDPFLDLSGRVGTAPEGGLLTMAFHPRYGDNGQVFVYYTDTGDDTVVERYTVSGDPDRLDPGSAKRILALTQRRRNHNGGMLQFGPDGMLYIFLGDEGGAGDPFGNGQNPETLHGSILRIDVDGGDPYAIPDDNPFAGEEGARGEIWAIGVRNPWRSTFDFPGDVLYVADVGQNEREEINTVPAGEAGVNYGWNTMEGSACFQSSECDMSGLTLPIVEYVHDGNVCSVTGGYVYRGSQLPEIAGHYFYSDFCTGFLRSFRLDGGRATDERRWNAGSLGAVSSFGVDGAGELYVVNLTGSVSRLERRQP
ncbi:PQQ-dependent sugar dehydrogenase [Candidatus Palauibacter soopunensis]|uniref:PQQ-dependent sugar dehydrogenase n=1 Tax=Candidatus Palauibacter soopunensis TaxID=3056739 RepID=UPI0023829710|nr:PQQ-dependent sugar dehydrogenase [Candidatus Palauibacter soopunensis]MDE2878355.1 PQQ-dependent sugar dehydrogenase [Candidatus Palauibacter soopunensis]